MLGFPYPGGPLIDKFAKEGDPTKFTFAKPNIQGLDFSFSGLKTSILYFLQKETKLNPNFIEENKADLCASIQASVVDILLKKITKAAKEYNIHQIAIAGGVSANSGLRNALQEAGKKYQWNVFIPKFEYCTDNAAMIAITGKFLFEKGIFGNQKSAAASRLPINEWAIKK
jgi:N6-L-threonylcarbamoyladenine synthase